MRFWGVFERSAMCVCVCESTCAVSVCVCACHVVQDRAERTFSVVCCAAVDLGFNLVYFSNVVIYAWWSRGLEMEGKWRHVACLWDFFVRGTVGGRFKTAESDRGGEEERNEKGGKKMALYESSDYFLLGWRNAALEIKEGLCLRQNVSLEVLVK